MPILLSDVTPFTLPKPVDTFVPLPLNTQNSDPFDTSNIRTTPTPTASRYYSTVPGLDLDHDINKAANRYGAPSQASDFTYPSGVQQQYTKSSVQYG
ncbi:unnamed protein product, partial [Allacma fusca]